jgi:transposase
MSGKSAGLQTIMREEYMPKGVYIHCCTHRLNLVIVDVCKVVNYIRDFIRSCLQFIRFLHLLAL